MENDLTHVDARTVGVALAGGGHRASAWSLGALLALHDLDVARRVKSIASVSGGSITNGFVGMHCDYRSANRSDFENVVTRPLAMSLAHGGTVFAWPPADAAKNRLFASAKVTGLTLAVLLVTLFGLMLTTILRVATWAAMLDVALSIEAFVFGVSLVVLLVTLRQRGPVSRHGYDEFFRRTPLAALPTGTEHVFCATDLQFAEHVYFSQRFVYSFRAGVGKPGTLPLADAVAASAAFPGGFPPIILPTLSFEFRAGAYPLRDHLVLLDGGLYDNMADQWFSGTSKRLSGRDGTNHAGERAELLTNACALRRPPDDLLIVNGSPSFPVGHFKSTWFLSFEIEALYRAVLSLYDQTTALRRQSLIRDALRPRSGTTSPSSGIAIISTETSPTSAIAMAPRDDPARNARLGTAERLVAARLGERGKVIDWDMLARRNASVSTTLDPLGAGAVADLIQHAAVLTAVQCHVYFSEPLPPESDWIAVFGRERFLRLVT